MPDESSCLDCHENNDFCSTVQTAAQGGMCDSCGHSMDKHSDPGTSRILVVELPKTRSIRLSREGVRLTPEDHLQDGDCVEVESDIEVNDRDKNFSPLLQLITPAVLASTTHSMTSIILPCEQCLFGSRFKSLA